MPERLERHRSCKLSRWKIASRIVLWFGIKVFLLAGDPHGGLSGSNFLATVESRETSESRLQSWIFRLQREALARMQSQTLIPNRK
eukprot:761133-Hanusia_phi.AAC.1